MDNENEDKSADEQVPEPPQPDSSPAWQAAIRPLKGFALGSIYVGKPPPKRQQKSGKKWVPPKVPMDAPRFCKEQGFSQTTCFDCIRERCYFEDIPERINKKRKETKSQMRERLQKEAVKKNEQA